MYHQNTKKIFFRGNSVIAYRTNLNHEYIPPEEILRMALESIKTTLYVNRNKLALYNIRYKCANINGKYHFWLTKSLSRFELLNNTFITIGCFV